MRKFNHFSLLVLSSILLASCFGGDNGETQQASSSELQQFESDNFSVLLPPNWSEVNEESLPAIPLGKLELAYQSTNLTKPFVNHIHILSDELTLAVDSAEYANRNIFQGAQSYTDFDLIDQRSIQFGSGQESIVYSFDAVYNEVTEKRRFVQTAVVCEEGDTKKGYLLTVGLDTSVEEDRLERYRTVLGSFSCR